MKGSPQVSPFVAESIAPSVLVPPAPLQLQSRSSLETAKPPAVAAATDPRVQQAASCLDRVSSKGVLSPDEVNDLHQSIEVLEVETWRLALGSEESSTATRRVIDRYVAAQASSSHPSPHIIALRSILAAHDGHGMTCASLRAADLDLELMMLVVVELERLRQVVEPLRRAHDAAQRLRARFVAANMGLVHSIARKYAWSATPFADLIQDGTLGLMHAIPRFDRAKGFRFSTYALNWIRQGIVRQLHDCGENVRIPVHAHESLYKINKARSHLRAQHGHDPSDAELSAATGIKVDVIQKLGKGIVGEARMSPEVTDRLFGKLPDAAESAVDVLIAGQDRAVLHAAIAKLAPRERLVVERLYGFVDDGEGCTLREVGEDAGVSRERIRQIQVAAIAKLRKFLLASGARG